MPSFSYEDAAQPSAPASFSYEEASGPAKPRGFIPYVAQQTKAGLSSDLPTIAGKALQYAGATDLGTRLREYGEANAAENQPDQNQGPITKAVAGALRGAAPIVPLAVGGLLAQGTPAGPALDVAGAAALAGGFGGAQAQDTFEKAKAAGKSDEEATSVARKTGAITGVGMGAVGALTGGVAAPALRALAGTGAKTAGDVIASEAAPGLVRPFVADTAGHLAGNVASMAAANAGTAAVEQNAGLPGPTPGEAAMEGVTSGVGLTAALLPFGLARGALANRANTAAVARLQSQEADPAQRAQVADRIHANLQAVDPAAAENFAQHATAAITNAQPLELGEHLLQPPTEGQYQPSEAQPAPLALPAPGTVSPGQTLVVNEDGAVATPPQMDLLRRPSDISETGAMGLGRNSDVTDVTPKEPTAAQKMGIDANAGPISNAATVAVDSGAHTTNAEGATATGSYPSGIEAQRALKATGEPGSVVRTDGAWRIQLDNPEAEDVKKAGTDQTGSSKAAAVGSAKPNEAVPAAGAPGEAQADGLRPFPATVGSLGVPRAEMPQITPTTHGPLTQFLAAKGIAHEVVDTDPHALKPTQGEYDPAKVREQQGNDASRTVLTSSDGYILDGTHQWLSRYAAGEPIKTIRFDAPIKDLLPLAKEFPSAKTAEEQAQAAPADSAGKAGPKSAATESSGDRATAPAPEQSAPALKKSTAQPTDIMNAEGEPFRNRLAAAAALKKAGAGHEVAPLAEGGFVVRPLPKTEAEPKPLHVGITPGNAEPVTVKGGIVHIGKEPALDFNSGEPVKVKDGAADADVKQALKDAGALSRRQKFFGGESEAPDNKLRIASPKGPAGGKNARSAAYEANPLKAFIAQHGLAPELAAEFAPGIKERRAAMVPGYGPIFRKSGLQMDALAERASEDGFIPKGDHDANRLYDLVARAFRGERIIPQYAEGAVEKEAQKHIEAHRELQDLKPHDLDAEGYDRVDPELQERVRELIAQAEQGGIDHRSILEDVAKRNENASADEYHAAARQALEAALAAEGSAREKDRSGPAGEKAPEPQGKAEGLTAPSREEVLAAEARKEAAPALDEKTAIDREADKQTLTQSKTPEQRTDSSGDMFAREKAQAEDDKKNAGKPKDDNGTTPMFSREAPDTEAFKKWFGDSKVVDADGKPLVVYHGTDADIEAFDDTKRGLATGAKSSMQGHFFVSDPNVAAGYSHHAATSAKVQQAIARADALERVAQRTGKQSDWEANYKAVEEYEAIDKQVTDERLRGQNIVPAYLALKNPAIFDAKGQPFTDITKEINAAIRQAKRDGKDGVILRNLDDDPGINGKAADHYVAFAPEQIKSATGNNGEFNPNNPDIRFKRAETTETGAMRPADIREAIGPATEKLKVPFALHSIADASRETGVEIPPDAKGMYYQGKLHVFSDGIRTALEAEQVFWHEVNHAGIDKLYASSKGTKDYYEAMRDMARQNANIRVTAKEWLAKFGAADTADRIANGMTREAAERRTKLQAVEEALSDLAGKNVTINGLTRFIAKAQEFMRAIGLNRLADALEKKTDAQALAMIFKARESVMKQPQVERAPNLSPAFSKDTKQERIALLASERQRLEKSLDDIKAVAPEARIEDGKLVVNSENATAVRKVLGTPPIGGASYSRTLDRISDRIDALKDGVGAGKGGALHSITDGLMLATMPDKRSKEAGNIAQQLRWAQGLANSRKMTDRAALNKAVAETTKAVTVAEKARDALTMGLTKADKLFIGKPQEHNWDFMQAMDSPDKSFLDKNPALKEVAGVMSRLWNERAKLVQDLDTGALQNLRENYFRHMWQQEPDADTHRQIFSTLSKSQFGRAPGSFKERFYEDFMAGVKAGLKPVSDNPMDIFALSMHELDKYIIAHGVLKATEGTNGVHLIAAGEKTPKGYTDINGRFGNIERNGEKLRYVARDDVAAVINNYVSQSLYHNKYVGTAFSKYMGAANTLNQFQLGVFSAFHAGFTSMEAVISHGALGVKAATEGDWKGAAKYMASAPAAWINNPRLGDKILGEWLNRGSHPEVAHIIGALQMAGARFEMDQRFRTDYTRNMMQAWADGKKFKAGINSIGALTEQSARPILEWLVPRQKAGVFGEMWNRWIEKNPDATHEEMLKSAQQIWNRVDSRLGQVVYDRLFVHNVAKNFAQMLIRAPGWTGGTILEVGGGIKDLSKWAANLPLALAKGEKPPGMTDRAAYTFSMLMTTAIANAALTAMFTGQAPKDWRDLVAFRTGNLDEHGRPERFMLPTYMKDVFAYINAPGTTLINKAHPLLSLIGDIGRNHDFYGTEIRSEDANILTQIAQTAGFAMKAFVPFWVRGVQKENEREGSALAKTAPFVGVMPAPSDLNKTAAEKLMTKYAVDKLPQGSRTQEESQKADLHRQMYLALRKGETDEAKELFAQGRDAGLFGPRDLLKVMRQAHQDPLVSHFQHLTYEQAERVMKVANDDEKRELTPLFMRKRLAWQRQHAGATTE